MKIMFKQIAGTILLSFTLSSSVLAQEVELISKVQSTQQTQTEKLNLSIEQPDPTTAELLADLLTVGNYELALDLALFYDIKRDNSNNLYYKVMDKPFYKITRAIAYQYLGKEGRAQAEFSETRKLLGIEATDKELADAVIIPNRSIGKETSNSLGINFFPQYDGEDSILEFINDHLHSRGFQAIDQAASFAIQVKEYADNPEFYLKRGIARYYLGKLEGAMSDFEKAKVLYRATGTMNERRQADWIINKFAFLGDL